MIDFIDILGDRHGAVTEYSIRHGVNGEKSISGTVYTNDEVIHGVDRGWRLEIDNEFYVITFAVPVDSGNKTQLEFDAVHEFFYEFSKKNVYSTLNGSNTAVRYLDFIFNGSGYQYNLEVTIPAFEKEEFGMTNRLALFNDFVKSTGVEFVVNNRVVRILREVGTDLSTIVKKGFNMQELRLEKNLKDFVTYKRGFGAWNNDEDQSQGRLEAVYRSPLADLYGELEDEPLVDERFSVKANLEERLQSDVENSYSISVQLTMEDLTKAGYEYEQPRTGDYIMAMNEDLGFEQKIRIVNYESHYDVNGQLIDHDITCNSLGIAQKNASSAGLLNTINQALNNANLALERANYAVVSTDGKTTNYFGEDDPINLGYEVRYKDTWYQVIGEDKVMNVWNGAEWEPITDTRVSKRNTELIAEQQAALEEVKTTADYSYDQLQQTIANSGFTDLDTAFANVKTLSEQADSKAYDAMQKAIDNASLIGGLDDSISTMTVEIDDINNSLTLKANTTEINRIDGTITDINNELTFQSGELSSKVSQSVYNADINSIETKQTQLTQTFNNFETSVTGSDGRLTLAEQFLDGFRNTAFDPSSGQLSLTEQTINGLQDTVSDPVNGLETRVTTLAGAYDLTVSKIATWTETYSVNTENPLPLKDIYGNNLVTFKSYDIILGVLTTGTVTYFSASLLSNNSSWTLEIHEQNGTSSNHPYIFLNENGYPMVGLYGHTSFYNVRATITEMGSRQKSSMSAMYDEISLRVQKDDLISQINIQADRTLIQTGKLLLDTETVVFGGDAFIPGAVIEDASIDTAKIADLAVTSAKIINLDVDKIIGNTTEFVKSTWNTLTNTVSISDGVRIDGYSNEKILFRNGNIEFYPVGYDPLPDIQEGIPAYPEVPYFTPGYYSWLNETGLSLNLPFNQNFIVAVGSGGFYTEPVFEIRPPLGQISMFAELGGVGTNGLHFHRSRFDNAEGAAIRSINMIDVGLGTDRYNYESIFRANSTVLSLFTKLNMNNQEIYNINGITSANNSALKFLSPNGGERRDIMRGTDDWVHINADGIGRTKIHGNTEANIVGTSDFRLKEKIEDTSHDSLQIINKIQFVDFCFKDKVKNPGKHFGFIAQQVDEYLQLYDEQLDIFGFSFNNLVMTTAHAVQQLKGIQDDIHKKTISNEERIEKLEAELKLLKGA